MDFDSEEKVDEQEIDALGIKKKNNADLDVDVDDPVVDTDDVIADPDALAEEDAEEHVFGVDKDTVEYMFSQSDHE